MKKDTQAPEALADAALDLATGGGDILFGDRGDDVVNGGNTNDDFILGGGTKETARRARGR